MCLAIGLGILRYTLNDESASGDRTGSTLGWEHP